MKNISPEIVDRIKKELGAESIFMIACDTKLPCSEQHGECEGKHEVSVAVDCISPLDVMRIVSDISGTDFLPIASSNDGNNS